ncbi:D-hexose-6-phosphate mutarotase [Paracidovorax avenae]|uniref:D-hexose-6-phosphate mutarotase n=1 Tax=Paracidovorax avenae TaxID=80867 RepID=UPI000D211447|nr:D-hexose-6-phosphate mutarotase [Paracidovorax avenae]AVS77126.1 D-hexose-6-phosphate mutarotase [Paracidovorax avenae]AVS92028.1 D-hexose-6-phosphate mutarotase [Paracidovorax avenae]
MTATAPAASPAPVPPFPDLPAVRLHSPRSGAAIVAFQGAQVLSWTTADGVERLFLSPRSAHDGHTAIRGGVPVCCPQFNQRGALPKHGFMRNLPWKLVSESSNGHVTGAVMALGDDEATRALWPHAFQALLAVELSGDALRLSLTLRNTGDAPWSFTGALHTYLRVADIARAQVDGLQGCARWDAVADRRGVQEGVVRFDGEYDSVFDAPGAPLRVDTGQGVLAATQGGWTENVVWNPGAGRCAALPDMPADGFRHMLCVEAACVHRPVEVAPGAEWTGWQRFEVLR